MRLFLYPEKDSIVTFILAERDLGFSFAKFKMTDQCEATEGKLNFHKRCTEARKIKISAGTLECTYLKDLDKTFHQLNKLAESAVKGNFGALRERTNYYRIGEIMSYASTKHGSCKDRNYSSS